MDKEKTTRLVISSITTSSINRELIRLSKIGWKTVEGSICFVRTHARNDITLLVEGPIKSVNWAFKIIEGYRIEED